MTVCERATGCVPFGRSFLFPFFCVTFLLSFLAALVVVRLFSRGTGCRINFHFSICQLPLVPAPPPPHVIGYCYLNLINFHITQATNSAGDRIFFVSGTHVFIACPLVLSMGHFLIGWDDDGW